jgi:hypothetical protein
MSLPFLRICKASKYCSDNKINTYWLNNMADIAKYRKSPRPSYYSAATGSEAEISINFETFLLNMSNQDKQTLITRLQKSITSARVNGPRDNLLKIALEFQGMNSGTAMQELNASLQEFSTFTTDIVGAAGDDVPEISAMMADISKCYGETVFRNNIEQNAVVAASFLEEQVGSGIGSGVSSEERKQISSWITVVASYILPGS